MTLYGAYQEARGLRFDAAIAEVGPPGFEEDPRPNAQALSAISPDTRQANRLVAGVQAYQDAAYQEAFLAWLPLAQAGYARAQLHLGALFLEGRGTERNDPLAYAWLTIARDNGSQNAGPLLDRLRANGVEVEVEEADDFSITVGGWSSIDTALPPSVTASLCSGSPCWS